MIRPEVIAAAIERLQQFALGSRPSTAEHRAAHLLAAAGVRTPQKTPILSVALGAARRAEEDALETAAKRHMHEAVWDWNIKHGAHCDCGCGYRFRHREQGDCDHWIERSHGGEHTRENGWRLTPWCHKAKTDNAPSRTEWNERRRIYCASAQIPFVERRER